MSDASPRLLILGAHPDDAEYAAGGMAALYRERDCAVKMVSVTNGGAGHHRHTRDELVAIRRAEAAAAGATIGAEYVTWDFEDGRLEPTLAVREAIIRELRTFAPDLVLTHRPCDYHPDHRAVGQAVQDASYMVTVPLVVPELPILTRDPVVAYMPDLFTRPNPLRVDAALDVAPQLDAIVGMLACHLSQVFDFLPYNHGNADEVPEGDDARLEWLRGWYRERCIERAVRFRTSLAAAFGPERGEAMELVEVYEISEYARLPSDEDFARLFPTAGRPASDS